MSIPGVIQKVAKTAGIVVASYAAGAIAFAGFVATAILLEKKEYERRRQAMQ